eukprot:CAMPEP_0170857194 /NCGR_PEP_ID=MMETSP0734-20130129/15110_1 /TAXON_ID=186038 /ORGANISM="Fragilariopsis kerguelensis, Strain L26-C5" /LENGTH=117 /DNA_ID=CAMNT_0011229311 /DNA_START=152 /DNA_END=501 /DNA_ORIENTATION=+
MKTTTLFQILLSVLFVALAAFSVDSEVGVRGGSVVDTTELDSMNEDYQHERALQRGGRGRGGFGGPMGRGFGGPPGGRGRGGRGGGRGRGGVGRGGGRGRGGRGGGRGRGGRGFPGG